MPLQAILTILFILLVIKFFVENILPRLFVPPGTDVPVDDLPYTRKKYVLTPAEFRFYKALRHATGDAYLIAPQVHLASLVAVNHGEREWQKYHNRIDRKSVDFVLFDKETVVALMAIELDDRSHQEARRQERDEFVNRLLAGSGLKLVRVPVKADYDAEGLKALLGPVRE